MSDLCAEARSALLAASMACDHAEFSLARARHYLWKAEDLHFWLAIDDDGTSISQRLLDAQCAVGDIRELLDMEAVNKNAIQWEDRGAPPNRTDDRQAAILRAEDALTRALDSCMDAYDSLYGFEPFEEAGLEAAAAAGCIVTVADQVAALREGETDE